MHGVLYGMDVAALTSIDGVDRQPVQAHVVQHAADDHLDLELETTFSAVQCDLYQAASNETVSALVIADGLADGPREGHGANRVCHPANEGHFPKGARADDQVSAALIMGPHEFRNLGRVVLSIRVERNYSIVAVVQRITESRTQCCALALVGLLVEDVSACFLGQGGGIICRTIVDDERGQVCARAADDLGDVSSLIECGDERKYLGHGVGMPLHSLV